MRAGKDSYAIAVEGLRKKYGDLVAVDGISFQVKPGELFGFLGPNGAGKTTTVNILTGVSLPTEGRASILGHDVVRDSFRAREAINVIPEVSNAYAEYSAWNNLMFTAALYGVPRREAVSRAEKLLRSFDLYEHRRSKVKGFSQGMRRKLVIAMGLINQPRVLFMDEPTTGLDVQSVLVIREMVRELNRKGITIFLTTHNLNEANILCDRVAIINRGKIIAVDSPENLKRAARSVQVVEVSFQPPAENGEADLRSLPGVKEVSKQGDKLRVITEDSSRTISDLNRYAEENGLRITYINTPGPTLEDVFVELTGLRKRG
ncbi:ATP-binding cassette domain-containing protein [Candidatus Solincola sp.]|nr:ATP-binding cassette domain-containing protein [Actinomycetota bacterium]